MNNQIMEKGIKTIIRSKILILVIQQVPPITRVVQRETMMVIPVMTGEIFEYQAIDHQILLSGHVIDSTYGL